MTIKGELQNPGPRHLKLVTQRVYVRSNKTQIFGDERQATQLLTHRFEEVGARTLHPLSGLSRWRARWNVPRGREAAEVIQANRIHVSEQGTQPVDRPPIAGCAQGLPVVNGIAPQLSLRAEVVGKIGRA